VVELVGGTAGGAPPFEARPMSKAGKHSALFWGGKHGAHHLEFIFRSLLLLCGICLQLIFSWRGAKPEDSAALVLALFPVLDVMMASPRRMLPALIIATAVEQKKHKGDTNATLLEMKVEKTLRMLKLLSLLEAQARRAQKLTGGKAGAKRPLKKRELEPGQVAELKSAFEFFDKDKSGYIDKQELSAVLGALGMELTPAEVGLLYVQMDPNGDGVIDFDEFTDVMAQDPAEKPSPQEMALSIFALLDKDGSGVLKTAELKSALVKMDAGLSEEDVEAAMMLFDQNRSGEITKHEFVQTIETLNTFE